MKKFCIFAAVFSFACGVFPAHAQDLIVLKDGNMIEAKVTEISPAEIRYNAFSNCTSLTSVTFVTGSNISDSNFGYYAFLEGEWGWGGTA